MGFSKILLQGYQIKLMFWGFLLLHIPEHQAKYNAEIAFSSNSTSSTCPKQMTNILVIKDTFLTAPKFLTIASNFLKANWIFFVW